MGASPFGAYWYPVRPLGDAVIRLQYTVQDTPTSTRNGGVMIRAPEIRYTGATTADVLAQKPTGLQLRRLPGRAPGLRAARRPAASTTYIVGGRRRARSRPPRTPRTRRSCTRAPTARAHGHAQRTNLAGTGPLTTNDNANNHQHWTQVYCGHEIQINETLTGGGPQPSARPDQDRLGLRLPQPQRQAVEDQRAARPRASGTTWRSARSASSTRC